MRKSRKTLLTYGGIALGIVVFVWLVLSGGADVGLEDPQPTVKSKKRLEKEWGERESFWDSFGKVEVFVLTIPQTMPYFQS